MNQIRLPATVLLAVATWVSIASLVSAQTNDRVYVKGETKSKAGSVIAVSRDGVQVKTGAKPLAIRANQIEKIIYDGDPSELTKGREFAVDGQYQQAIEEFDNVGQVKRPEAKADFDYYLMMCHAKLALAGQGNKNDAIAKARAFAGANSNSYHFYDAARLLGDLALAVNDNAKALQYYGAMAKSQSPETAIASAYLVGLAKLKGKDVAGATTQFDKVIGVRAATPEILRQQMLAKAGKAVAMAQGGKGADALKLVDTLIAELNPTDVEMSSRIYNAQGASYEAAGDDEGAIIAYLHTHLMFSSQPDAHAEALSRLITLWPKVGKPERAAEARQEMNQRYPGYGK